MCKFSGLVATNIRYLSIACQVFDKMSSKNKFTTSASGAYDNDNDV